MTNRLLLLFLVMTGALHGAVSLETQKIHLTLDQYGYQINNHKAEIDLLYERIQGLESALGQLHQELAKKSQTGSLEKRFFSLEKAHETLIQDFKTFKTHVNETKSALSKCQERTDQISSDVKTLKSSLHSMLALLQKGDSQIYVVQTGDSLGQIALDHRTDVKKIKESNDLSDDTIYAGQELIIP